METVAGKTAYVSEHGTANIHDPRKDNGRLEEMVCPVCGNICFKSSFFWLSSFSTRVIKRAAARLFPFSSSSTNCCIKSPHVKN